MRGYLKAACVIQQCTRCYALRDLTQEAGECRSCRALLNVSHTETRSLSFGDVSSDIVPRSADISDNNAGGGSMSGTILGCERTRRNQDLEDTETMGKH